MLASMNLPQQTMAIHNEGRDGGGQAQSNAIQQQQHQQYLSKGTRPAAEIKARHHSRVTFFSPAGRAALEDRLVAFTLPLHAIRARGEAKRVHAILVDALVHHVVHPAHACQG